MEFLHSLPTVELGKISLSSYDKCVLRQEEIMLSCRDTFSSAVLSARGHCSAALGEHKL